MVKLQVGTGYSDEDCAVHKMLLSPNQTLYCEARSQTKACELTYRHLSRRHAAACQSLRTPLSRRFIGNAKAAQLGVEILIYPQMRALAAEA